MKLVHEVIFLENVTPGGIKDYVFRARKFLEDSKNSVNPYDHYKPEVPKGTWLHPGTDEMNKMEEIGL